MCMHKSFVYFSERKKCVCVCMCVCFGVYLWTNCVAVAHTAGTVNLSFHHARILLVILQTPSLVGGQ